MTDTQRILSSSAVMAAGTVVSRLSGFVRATLLVAALGSFLHADVFNIANTVPNMLYILLAGGIFNAVLVPQLVRAQKEDPDGGDAYASRVITLAAMFLLAVTAVLVVSAGWFMQLFLDSSFNSPALAEQKQSVIAFARYCLPQVFFYGMFVLAGQVLNARGRFGPMMWAPIANNVIAVLVLVAYLVVFGKAEGEELYGGFTPGQELLLGLGSTLGIAVQFLILLPYLKAAGFSYRPRFDFRDAGLGHTLRLGVWTVLFVIVNQIAYTVVVRLASSGTTTSDGTGYTIYSSSFLLVMVPHSIVTVSLATAILPRLSASAAEADLHGLAQTLAGTVRTTLCFVVPFMAALPLVALELSHVVFGYGAGADTYSRFAPTLALFAPAIVLFTVHYLMLRGFYALERTRTVFWIQCAVASTNIVLAVVLVTRTDAAHTAPALVTAYAGAYLVGALLSYAVLRRLLGGLETSALLGFLARLVPATAVAVAVAWGVRRVLQPLFDDPDQLTSALFGGIVISVAGLVFVAAARLFRISEVAAVVNLVTHRLRRS